MQTSRYRTHFPCCRQAATLTGDGPWERRCQRCGRGWNITLADARATWTNVDLGHDGYIGCLQRRTSQETGLTVGLYCAAPAGIEDDPETPWALVCEEHSNCICCDTLTQAKEQMADPLGWCETCMYGEAYANGTGPKA